MLLLLILELLGLLSGLLLSFFDLLRLYLVLLQLKDLIQFGKRVLYILDALHSR